MIHYDLQETAALCSESISVEMMNTCGNNISTVLHVTPVFYNYPNNAATTMHNNI